MCELLVKQKLYNYSVVLVVVTAVVIAWLWLSLCCICQRSLVNCADYTRIAHCSSADLFSGQMRWVLARAWNDNDVWSRDSDFTAGGRKSWFRHQDVHPQGQNGKDKDGVGRLALSLENNLLSDYKNETIGTDPLALFYFHHAIFDLCSLLCNMSESHLLYCHLISTRCIHMPNVRKKYVRIIRSHVPPSHLVLFSSLLLYKRHPPNFYYYFILSKWPLNYVIYGTASRVLMTIKISNVCRGRINIF